MEPITEAQLKSALTPTGAPLQRRLPQEEFTALGILLNRTAKRYPNQDLTDALPEYMRDLEQLSLRYSLLQVEDAIAALRVDPEQVFFPTPNEIAAHIQRAKLKKLPSHLYARG